MAIQKMVIQESKVIERSKNNARKKENAGSTTIASLKRRIAEDGGKQHS